MDREACLTFTKIYYDLYKLSTFIVFFLLILTLIGMHYLCPIRWHRQMFAKTVLKMRKIKKRKFFDTRSISANTEFDFQANKDEDQQQEKLRTYPSILKTDEKHSFNQADGGQTHRSKIKSTEMESRHSEYFMEKFDGVSTNQQKEKALQNKRSTSFAALPEIIGSSRGQLRDRRPSVVTFDLDSKTKQTKYNTIAGVEKMQSRSRNKQSEFYRGMQDQAFLARRSSSSIDLVSSSVAGTGIIARKPLNRSYSTIVSINDLHNMPIKRNHRVRSIGSTLSLNPSLAKNTREEVYEDDIDEGQMQCIFQYDRLRSILVIKDLQIKASFPVGIPGFIVEVGLEPKAMAADVVRSKVYVTEQQHVEIRLEETFRIICDDRNIERCSIVITVVPILGDLLLFVETDLNELNLLENGEIFLGGFFKSTYAN